MEGRTLQGRVRHEAKPPALVALLPSGSDLIRDSLLQHQRNPSRRSATALAFRIPVWRRVVGQPRPLVSSRARSPRPGAGPSSRPKLADRVCVDQVLDVWCTDGHGNTRDSIQPTARAPSFGEAPIGHPHVDRAPRQPRAGLDSGATAGCEEEGNRLRIPGSMSGMRGMV